jgi:hypothetical protein
MLKNTTIIFYHKTQPFCSHIFWCSVVECRFTSFLLCQKSRNRGSLRRSLGDGENVVRRNWDEATSRRGVAPTRTLCLLVEAVNMNTEYRTHCWWRDILLLFENCAVLGYYAASSSNFLPTFRDKLSVPSSRVENPKRIQGFLALEDGTDRLSQNFGKKLPLLVP